MLASQTLTIRPQPQIRFGVGASLKLADNVRLLRREAALVVTDRTLLAAGVLDPALEALRAAGVRVEVFDGVDANPTDRNVEAGARRLRDMQGACLIAFGGGSSMDCGKAIALLAPNADTLEALQASRPAHPAAPIIAVPTTAGTGSETNNASVVTDTRTGRKTYVLHASTTPAFAVLDPGLTVGLPAYPTATCGFDVLTHAMEAFVSPRAIPYTDAVAMEAMKIVADHLRTVVKDGSDLEGRSQLLMASAMAAIAFNTAGLGAAHGTGHALSARLNAAHGQTLATMLPSIIDFNMPVSAEKYARIAGVLAPAGPSTGAALIDAVLALRADIGLARSIEVLGADEALLPTLVADAAADVINATNPRPVDEAAAEALYRAAWRF